MCYSGDRLRGLTGSSSIPRSREFANERKASRILRSVAAYDFRGSSHRSNSKVPVLDPGRSFRSLVTHPTVLGFGLDRFIRMLAPQTGQVNQNLPPCQKPNVLGIATAFD
jgi:hypothetical protein